MEEISQQMQQVDPERLKNFVRHVCVIAKKQRDREHARVELNRQMQRLKRFASKKKEMGEELQELNRKISLVLEKEMELIGIKQGESSASKELMRMAAENKEKIRQLNDTIIGLRGMIKDYAEMKMERERRIDELERKIKSKVQKKKDVSLLKGKLRQLEDMYNKLRKKGIDASRIAERIEGLKARMGEG